MKQAIKRLQNWGKIGDNELFFRRAKAILENNSAVTLGTNIKIGCISHEIVFKNEKETVYDVARKYFIGDEENLRSGLYKFMFLKIIFIKE